MLDGTRILDLTSNAAGPYAVWLLASLGAEVIKVESEVRPDPARGAANRPYAHSIFFEDINAGKRCIELDLKTDAGVEDALSLVSECDAVVDSFRPGVMQRLGLGSDTVAERNPKAVSASLSATGAVGPLAGLPGYAGIFNALGGLGGLTGYDDGPPTELRTSIDLRCGALFATMIAWALHEASRTGRGRHLDFSAVEAVALLGGEHLTATLGGAVDLEERIGNRDEHWAPHGVFPTAGGQWLTITVRDDDEFAAMRELMMDDHQPLPREVAEDRFGAVDEVEHTVAEWTVSNDRDALCGRLLAAGVPAAPVLDASEVSREPLLVGRDFYGTVQRFDDGQTHRMARAPWILDGARPMEGPVRALGADTEAVRQELLGPATAGART